MKKLLIKSTLSLIFSIFLFLISGNSFVSACDAQCNAEILANNINSNPNDPREATVQDNGNGSFTLLVDGKACDNGAGTFTNPPDYCADGSCDDASTTNCYYEEGPPKKMNCSAAELRRNEAECQPSKVLVCPTNTPPASTNTPTPKATPTSGPSSTPRPSQSPTPRPSASPTPSTKPTATPTRAPSATPTTRPTPTPTRVPSNTPTPTRIPTPTATPTNTPTPTPTPVPFDPAMCKCDGIEYTDLYGGQPTKITANAKVEGPDTSWAKVVGMEFLLYEGTATSSKILQRSGDLPANIISQMTGLTRYSSVWNLTLPKLTTGQTYRIQAQIDCQPTTPRTTMTTSNVLIAQASQNGGFFDKLFGFFARLFTGNSGSVPKANPTATPYVPAQSSQLAATPTPRVNLQLDTIYPVQVEQKTCNFIKFKATTLGRN